MAWRNCGASLALLDAVNARWPQRDKTSDGAIGDAAHATRASDHNPWVVVDGMGVVRARDIDVDGIDAAWCVEQLRLLGAAGDVRLRGGGYVIFNRRITAPDFSGWKSYTGSNPHDKHFHVSFSLDRGGFDSSAPWPFLQTARTPTPEEEDDTMPQMIRNDDTGEMVLAGPGLWYPIPEPVVEYVKMYAARGFVRSSAADVNCRNNEFLHFRTVYLSASPLTPALDYRPHHGAEVDNLLGHVLSIRQEVEAASTGAPGLPVPVDASAVAAVLGKDVGFADLIAERTAEKLATRLAS